MKQNRRLVAKSGDTFKNYFKTQHFGYTPKMCGYLHCGYKQVI